MGDFKSFSRIDFFLIGRAFFYILLFFSTIFAQPSSLPRNSPAIDLRLPLKLCLHKQIDKLQSNAIASDNLSSLFVAFQTGKVGRINLEKNSLTWTSDLGGEIVSDLFFGNDRVFLITRVLSSSLDRGVSEDKPASNYILWSIDAEIGVTVWQFPFSANGFISLNDFQDKLFLTVDDGTIISIRKFDAQKIFYRQIGQALSSAPSFSENKIYIASADNSIISVSAETGEIISKIPTLQSPATSIVNSGDKLYWGEKEGFVNLFKLSDKSRVWSVRQGGEISSLTFVSNGILVSSLDNFIYLISPQKGKRIWKRRLASRILAKPSITGDFVVFVTAIDNKAVVLDLRDGKVVNQISLDDKGFVLSTPLIVNNLLVFPTSKGIFAFASEDFKCPYN